MAATRQDSGRLLRRRAPIPATDKDVAQVDTLLITNACVGRAERVAFLKLLSDEFPSFVRANPPPAARSPGRGAARGRGARVLRQRPAGDLPDRYFPRLVNLMSPAYWIYLAMGITILLNGSDIYSRFRLWRLDASREAGVPAQGADRPAPDAASRSRHFRPTPSSRRRRTARRRRPLMKDLEKLRDLCKAQVETSWVTPMGSEMYYRYQEVADRGSDRNAFRPARPAGGTQGGVIQLRRSRKETRP